MSCFASLMTVAPIIYRYKMQKSNRGSVLKSPGTKPEQQGTCYQMVTNALGPPLEKKTFECLVCFADDYNANNLSA